MGVGAPSQLGHCTSCCKPSDSTQVGGSQKYWDRIGEWDRRAVTLANALRDEDWRIRELAVRNLGRLKHAAVPYGKSIGEMMNDECWQVRKSAIKSLGKLGESSNVAREHVPGLLVALSDSQPDVRSAAMETLQRIRTTLNSNFAAQLMDQESHQEPMWMQSAAIGDMIAARNFRLGLHMEDDDPRGYWAYAFHQIEKKKAFDLGIAGPRPF